MTFSDVCTHIYVSRLVVTTYTGAILMDFAVEREGGRPTHLLVLVFGGVEGNVEGRVQEDLYVFSRSPLFRRGFPFCLFLSNSHSSDHI